MSKIYLLLEAQMDAEALKELGLKEDELIALVIREDKSIIPDGKTVLLEKDVVVLYK